MVETMVIYDMSQNEERLISSLVKYFPQLRITAVAHSCDRALSLITSHQPGLLIYDLDLDLSCCEKFLKKMDEDERDAILISSQSPDEEIFLHDSVSGLVRKPIIVAELVVTVRNTIKKIALKTREKLLTPKEAKPINDIVGIPTFEGFEYLNINQIIRCEGLQKCTRVVIDNRKDLISAYPIGAFKELLIPYGFYDVHRSHIINMKKVNRYSREGFIYLTDGSTVPLARRKRPLFFSNWNHLKVR
jgi:two-component system LytT family response regulator